MPSVQDSGSISDCVWWTASSLRPEIANACIDRSRFDILVSEGFLYSPDALLAFTHIGGAAIATIIHTQMQKSIANSDFLWSFSVIAKWCTQAS